MLISQYFAKIKQNQDWCSIDFFHSGLGLADWFTVSMLLDSVLGLGADRL